MSSSIDTGRMPAQHIGARTQILYIFLMCQFDGLKLLAAGEWRNTLVPPLRCIGSYLHRCSFGVPSLPLKFPPGAFCYLDWLITLVGLVWNMSSSSSSPARLYRNLWRRRKMRLVARCSLLLGLTCRSSRWGGEGARLAREMLPILADPVDSMSAHQLGAYTDAAAEET